MSPAAKQWGDLRYYCKNHEINKCNNMIRVGIYCEKCKKEKPMSTQSCNPIVRR